MKKQTQSDTKQKIITAFLDLMREIEFDDINVKEIALKANVGRATFYRHFKQKQDIVISYCHNRTIYTEVAYKKILDPYRFSRFYSWQHFFH